MNLTRAVQLYVQQKHRAGIAFPRGARSLQCFCSLAGDVPIEDVQQHDVSAFLNRSLASAVTWQVHYRLLQHFFLYWAAREQVAAPPLPPPRARVIRTFVPYIYSRAELRRLFAATRLSQMDVACTIDARTFRTFLIFLYATGALLGEARHLERKDIDLKNKQVAIVHGRSSRSRVIPIGVDLCRILSTYDETKRRDTADMSTPFFTSTNGEDLKESTVGKSFQRARALSGITRSDSSRYQPRLHDLRHTFAVHRTTSWFKHGADINRMMPALAAYLGQVELASSERYLKMTPERFRKQLNILSPTKGKTTHWRNNAPLMRFVDAL